MHSGYEAPCVRQHMQGANLAILGMAAGVPCKCIPRVAPVLALTHAICTLTINVASRIMLGADDVFACHVRTFHVLAAALPSQCLRHCHVQRVVTSKLSVLM